MRNCVVLLSNTITGNHSRGSSGKLEGQAYTRQECSLLLDSPLVNLEHCPHGILSWLWEYHLLGNFTRVNWIPNYKKHKAIPISIRHTSEGSKLGQSLEFPVVSHAYHVKYQEKLIQKSEDLGFSPGFFICWRKKNQVSFLRSYFLLCKWGIDPYSAYLLVSMRVKLNHIHRFRERQLTTSQTARLWVSRY